LRNYEHIQARNGGYIPKIGLGFMAIDALAFLPLLLVVFWLSDVTITIFLINIIFFGVLEFMGYDVKLASKRARSIVAGKLRLSGRPTERRRKLLNG